MKIGYLQGAFDMFNIKHLNVLKNAKSKCDYLVVGVINDELCKKYFKVDSLIKNSDRMEIVSSIKYVDEVLVVDENVKSILIDKNVNIIFDINEPDFCSLELDGCTCITIDSSHSCENDNVPKSNRIGRIGYTTGVFDLFHIGHLNIIKKSKERCNYLIVGVSTDDVVENYKNKKPVISFNDRIEIIKSLKYVDEVVPQTTMDKMKAWNKLKFDVLFHGSDWKNSEMYNKIISDFKIVGVSVEFLPHTDGISSTILTEKIKK